MLCYDSVDWCFNVRLLPLSSKYLYWNLYLDSYTYQRNIQSSTNVLHFPFIFKWLGFKCLTEASFQALLLTFWLGSFEECHIVAYLQYYLQPICKLCTPLIITDTHNPLYHSVLTPDPII